MLEHRWRNPERDVVLSPVERLISDRGEVTGKRVQLSSDYDFRAHPLSLMFHRFNFLRRWEGARACVALNVGDNWNEKIGRPWAEFADEEETEIGWSRGDPFVRTKTPPEEPSLPRRKNAAKQPQRQRKGEPSPVQSDEEPDQPQPVARFVSGRVYHIPQLVAYFDRLFSRRTDLCDQGLLGLFVHLEKYRYSCILHGGCLRDFFFQFHPRNRLQAANAFTPSDASSGLKINRPLSANPDSSHPAVASEAEPVDFSLGHVRDIDFLFHRSGDGRRGRQSLSFINCASLQYCGFNKVQRSCFGISFIRFAILVPWSL